LRPEGVREVRVLPVRQSPGAYRAAGLPGVPAGSGIPPETVTDLPRARNSAGRGRPSPGSGAPRLAAARPAAAAARPGRPPPPFAHQSTTASSLLSFGRKEAEPIVPPGADAHRPAD